MELAHLASLYYCRNATHRLVGSVGQEAGSHAAEAGSPQNVASCSSEARFGRDGGGGQQRASGRAHNGAAENNAGAEKSSLDAHCRKPDKGSGVFFSTWQNEHLKVTETPMRCVPCKMLTIARKVCLQPKNDAETRTPARKKEKHVSVNNYSSPNKIQLQKKLVGTWDNLLFMNAAKAAGLKANSSCLKADASQRTTVSPPPVVPHHDLTGEEDD
eukprot:614916-Pyramimonas_sp.AAC.1